MIFIYFRTYNQLWGKAQNEIQTVLSNESQAFIGKSEKVKIVEMNCNWYIIVKIQNVYFDKMI